MEGTESRPPAVRIRPLSFDLQLPPLPSTVVEISELLAAGIQQVDLNRLTHIIERDVATSVALLRRVNSAYYGLRVRVSDVGRAVRLLGIIEVSNIVATISVLKLRQFMRTEEQRQIYKNLLCYSLGAAFFAQLLADGLELPVKALAFTGGLLHNVGRLVFLYNDPELYEAIWYGTSDGQPPSAEEERHLLGVDYVEVGAQAVREWNFAEELELLVRHQFSPESLPPLLRPVGCAIAVGMWVAYRLPHMPWLDWHELAGKRFFRQLAELAEVRPADLIGMLQHNVPRAKEFVYTSMEG